MSEPLTCTQSVAEVKGKGADIRIMLDIGLCHLGECNGPENKKKYLSVLMSEMLRACHVAQIKVAEMEPHEIQNEIHKLERNSMKKIPA